MKQQLVLRFKDSSLTSSTAVTWLLFDHTAVVVDSGETELSALAEQWRDTLPEYQISVIVPGESVFLTSASIPSKQLRQIKQALPFAVEEQIADDIDSVHLAIPASLPGDSEATSVAVVRHELMINWLDVLYQHGLSPVALIPETLCVPKQANSISLLLDQDELLVRTEDYQGAGYALDDMALVIQLLQADIEAINTGSTVPYTVHVISSEQGADDTANRIASQLRSCITNEVKEEVYAEPPVELLAATAINQNTATINLLQGGYSLQQSSNPQWRQWRLAASIAAVGIGLYLLLALASGWYFDYRANQLNAEAVSLYKNLFPQQRRVVSPKKQLESYLRQFGAGGNTHFLALLAKTAQQFDPSTGNANLSINQLRFDSNRSDLYVEVQSRSIENLDQLKQTLSASGLRVDINSAIEKDNFVVGKIMIRSQ